MVQPWLRCMSCLLIWTAASVSSQFQNQTSGLSAVYRFPGASTKAFFRNAVETTLQEVALTPSASLKPPMRRKAGVSSSKGVSWQ